MFRRVPSLLIVALVPSACVDRPPDESFGGVRDSAGIRIVENVAPISRVPWRFSSEPTVEIRGDGDRLKRRRWTPRRFSPACMDGSSWQTG